jgi:succinoglycan biosynthesis transport protein ExoP
MLIAGVATLLTAACAALLWPPTYRSIGTILIEQQELPSDLVQSTITSFADQRIQVISQRVMTTDNLLRIVERYNLYPDLRRKSPREVLLAQLRKDIQLQMISADVIDPRQGHATKANIAFSVSYKSRSPETSARVANEVVSLYLDENVKSRRQLTADAERFLDDEANKLDKHIAELEAQVTAFKDQHIHTLPDQETLNKETLIRREDELRELDAQMSALAQQLTYLDAQLAQIAPNSQIYTSTGERVMSPADRLKYLRTEYARVSGLYSPEHPDVQRIEQEMAGLEKEAGGVDARNDLRRQLDDDQSQLAQLRDRDAPDHPDVVRLQQQIDALTRSISRAPTAPSQTEPQHPDNPAYIQIKAQRQANQAQQDALKQRRDAVQDELSSLEGRLAAAPAIERAYADLLRGLENEQIKYREVRQKQMAAKLSENLEDEQKGERFTLIDPPLVPEEPSSPNRKLLIGAGVVLAVAAGLLTVALLESTDHTVKSRGELEALLEVPPLAVLPLMETRADRARQRRRRWLALAATTGGCTLALLLTHWLYRPLDVLWDSALRRLMG